VDWEASGKATKRWGQEGGLEFQEWIDEDHQMERDYKSSGFS
jgi:hypothetical protein